MGSIIKYQTIKDNEAANIVTLAQTGKPGLDSLSNVWYFIILPIRLHKKGYYIQPDCIINRLKQDNA